MHRGSFELQIGQGTASDDADASAPVLAQVEAVHLDLGTDVARESVERAVEAEHRRDEIDERWPVRNFGVAEQTRAHDVARAPVRLDATPVVRALERERRVLRDLQLDDGQTTVAPEREKVNGPRRRRAPARHAELRVQWREAQP